MPAPEQITLLPGLAPLIDRYDGLVLDLWGVIHDGATPYPGVTHTLAHLARAGKKVVMLSNAPRRADAVIEAMTGMGIARALYTDVLSSGELAWRALRARTDPRIARLGRRCLHVGPARDHGILDGLDLERIDGPEPGAFILNTGPWLDGETVADYEDLLGKTARAGMAMICANPDIEVIRAGKRIVCAGALARRYAELGGEVIYFGKPFAHAYAACLEVMGIADKARLLAVGDSLETDIRGAADAGIDAVLVTSGLHAETLGLAFGEAGAPEAVSALCRDSGLWPLAVIPAFRV